MIAVGFALSCFGLLLFLWIAFGGPVPLKPTGYRITAFFPEAIALAQESDVRIGGVSVGKVKTVELADTEHQIDGLDTTKAEIEIEPEFAPIASDARATLRQKTLLGETYVELTSGTPAGERSAPVALGDGARGSDAADAAEPIPEGGELGLGRVRVQTQIDDIFNALDEQTRASFQRWLANSAVAIEDRGLDLNDALGNLAPFAADASELLRVLRRQRSELQGLVRDTGEVFEALTERDQQLAELIVGSNQTFEALASEERALAETVRILPTFERETRTTLDRLDDFQADTLPLVRQLTGVADDLTPTLRSVRRLSPRLRELFPKLDRLVDASDRGLPALESTLGELGPVLDALDPFLANLNPVARYLRAYKKFIPDFFGGPPFGLANTFEPVPGQAAPRRGLRQEAYLSAESLSVFPDRLPTNRGNGYLQPDFLNPRAAAAGIFPNFDCDPSDGERLKGDGGSPEVGPGFAPCILSPDFPDFGGGKFPNLTRDP